MRTSRLCTMLVLAALVAACARAPIASASADVEVVEQPRWISVASVRDLARIDRLPAVWGEVLVRARRGGHGRRIAAEGRLLDPDAALPWPAPSPGAYVCRLVRIEASRRPGPALTAFPDHFCHVGFDGDLLFVTKRSGDLRPGGFLWPDADPHRLVFLGALGEGGEDAPPAYGDRPASDVAGVFERIGPLRYRLVMPSFDPEPMLDVLELTPAPVQPDE